MDIPTYEVLPIIGTYLLLVHTYFSILREVRGGI